MNNVMKYGVSAAGLVLPAAINKFALGNKFSTPVTGVVGVALAALAYYFRPQNTRTKVSGLEGSGASEVVAPSPVSDVAKVSAHYPGGATELMGAGSRSEGAVSASASKLSRWTAKFGFLTKGNVVTAVALIVAVVATTKLLGVTVVASTVFAVATFGVFKCIVSYVPAMTNSYMDVAFATAAALAAVNTIFSYASQLSTVQAYVVPVLNSISVPVVGNVGIATAIAALALGVISKGSTLIGYCKPAAILGSSTAAPAKACDEATLTLQAQDLCVKLAKLLNLLGIGGWTPEGLKDKVDMSSVTVDFKQQDYIAKQLSVIETCLDKCYEAVKAAMNARAVGEYESKLEILSQEPKRTYLANLGETYHAMSSRHFVSVLHAMLSILFEANHEMLKDVAIADTLTSIASQNREINIVGEGRYVRKITFAAPAPSAVAAVGSSGE